MIEKSVAEANGSEAAELDDKSSVTKASKRSGSKRKPKQKKKKEARKPTKKISAKRPYPRVPLEQALRIPVALKEKNGGNPWPPADVAKSIGLSHKNTDFFYLAASSRDFGFTEGSRDSEQISLTEFGRDVVYAPGKAEEKEKLREALLKVDIFAKVLDYYKGANLPEMQYLGNTLVREFGLDPSLHEEFSKLFRENCKFLDIGSGFSDSGSLKSPRSQIARDNASTVVLAEPAKATGLRCFVIMPFRVRETTRSSGFFDEVL